MGFFLAASHALHKGYFVMFPPKQILSIFRSVPVIQLLISSDIWFDTSSFFLYLHTKNNVIL